jgi:hypothetical protein
VNFGKLFDTLKGPLLAAASTVIPGGPLILAAVNEMLPDGQKLPATATGADMRAAVNTLPADQRGSLMEKELDVEIAEINAWEGIQASLAQADASGASTRPYIAKLMAWCVVIAIALFMGVWAVAVLGDDVATLEVLSESWPMILALVATPTALLRAYFGMRTKEKTARYSAASGQPLGGIANLIGALRK